MYKLAIAGLLVETNKLEMNKWKIWTTLLSKSRIKKMVKIEEGVRNGFFYILFPASMIKIFTVQDYRT